MLVYSYDFPIVALPVDNFVIIFINLGELHGKC